MVTVTTGCISLYLYAKLTISFLLLEKRENMKRVFSIRF